MKNNIKISIVLTLSIIAMLLNGNPVKAGRHHTGGGHLKSPVIVILHYENKAEVMELKDVYDIWRLDEKNQTALMVVDGQADIKSLENHGFKVEIEQNLMRQQEWITRNKFLGIKTIDNFPCYRTVAETFDAMNDMQTNYPNLVTLVDIGDSWEKTQDANQGHDMQVVKITNQAITTPDKPILYAMGSIHSREYPPAELVTRFAEYLLSEYGNNADATWLVDHHEIHLLLQGNPDGRVISEGESSAFQRKNYNANHCPGGGGGGMQGVDMNRNFEFLWNQGTGSSGSACSQAFRGPSAVSEPETQAINDYIQTLFPDQRPNDLTTPAPLDKPGVYLDIHNVAELTLFPWGYADNAGQAPNHDQLQTLARKMSFFTGYRPEQSNSSLGGADGASDDNAYGTLGVAAYTIELGEGGFYSSCSAFENTIWPDNLPALIYAAKAARMPYTISSGPDVIDLPTQAVQIAAGQMLNVSGTATDLQFNNGAPSTGDEPTQNITAVTAYLETPPWEPAAIGANMSASDGSFDAKSEAFNGSVDTSNLNEGKHIIWFTATDAAGVTGVPAAIFVDVVDPNDIGTVAGEVRDAGSNALLEQVTITYDGLVTMTDNNGTYSIQTTATTSDLTVAKNGYLSQTIASVVTTGGQTTTQNIMLEPSCDDEILFSNVEGYNDINQAVSDGWSLLTSLGTNDWRVASGDNHTTGGTKAFISSDVASTSDKSLATPALALTTDAELVFWHKHDFESSNANYDGGVIEISTDGGNNWSDLGGAITQNGYNGTLDGGFNQPLGAVPAFVDNLGTFTEVKVDLSAYNNQTVKIRWRMGTDNSTSAGDWKIDDISVIAPAECTNPNDLIFEDGFETP